MYFYTIFEVGDFFMEIIMQKVKQNIEKVQDTEQVTFDHDYVIKDNKPDVIRVVCQSGQVKVDEVKAVGENIWVNGTIEFEVLYKSETADCAEDGSCRTEAVKDVIPFQEKIVLEGICDGDTVRVYACIDDLSVGIINSRKLSIRGIINMDIYCEREEDTQIAAKVSEPGVEQLSDQVSILELDCAIRDIIRIRNDVTLPKTKPNIWKLLTGLVDIRNLEYTYDRDRVTITGETHACIVYLSEEQEICCFETQENFSNEIRCDSEYVGNLAWIRTQLLVQQVEAENDYDGEPRQLSIELALTVDGKVWCERSVDVLKDLYSVSCSIKPVYEKRPVCRLLMKNDTKCRILEQMYREPGENRILRICGTKTSAQIEQIRNTDGGILVTGVLTVNCINIVEDDGCPIEMHTDQVPFEQFVEILGIDSSTYCEVNVQVDQVQVNLMDNSEYEIKSTVSINAIALQQDMLDVITKIDETEEAFDGSSEAGLVGYIVQKNDKMWDIAKKYHTTIDNIMAVNNLDTSEIQQNDRLIIARMGKIC